jgi:hypothetical protein
MLEIKCENWIVAVICWLLHQVGLLICLSEAKLDLKIAGNVVMLIMPLPMYMHSSYYKTVSA